MLHAFSGDVGGAMGSASSALDAVSTRAVALGTVLGNLTLGALKGVADGILNTGREALGAVAGYERLSLSLETLSAREIYNASAVTKTVLAGKSWRAATEEQVVVNGKTKKSVDDITFSANKLANQLALTTDKLGKMEAANANGASKTKYSAAQIDQQRIRIEELTRAQGKQWDMLKVIPATAAGYVNTYKTVTEHTMTMAEAQKQAAVRAQELLNWIQKVAIQSPFNRDDVAAAYKTALVYGYTGKEAQRLTQILIDFGAATGASGEMLGQVAYPLGQIRSGSKLYTQDLRQLMNAGVDVNGILGKMGYKLEDVGKTSIDSKKFLELFMETMEQDFGGAGKKQAGTFAGLLASLDDLKDVALRDVFTPIFEKARPALDKFITALQDPGIRSTLQSMGAGIGEFLGKPLSFVGDLFDKGRRFLGLYRQAVALGVTPTKAFGNALKIMVPANFHKMIDTAVKAVEAFGTVMWRANDPVQAVKGAVSAVFDVPTAETINQGIDTAVGAFKGVKEKVETALTGVKDIVLGALTGASPEQLGQKAGTLLNNLITSISDAASDPAMLSKVGDTLASWGTKILEFLTPAVKAITPGLTGFATNIGFAAGETVGLVLTALADWITTMAGFPGTIKSDRMSPAVKAFVDELGKAFTAAKDLLTSIGNGLGAGILAGMLDSVGISGPSAEAFLKYFQQASEEYKKSSPGNQYFDEVFTPNPALVAARTANALYEGVRSAQSLIGAAGETITVPVQFTPALGNYLAAMTMAAPNTWQDDYNDMGTSLAGGVASGVGSTKAVSIAMVRAVDDARDAVQAAYGIKSPSTVMAAQVGKPLGEGITGGVTDGLSGLGDAVMRAINSQLTVENIAPSEKAFLSTGERMAQTFMTGFTNVLTGSNTDAAVRSMFAGAGGGGGAGVTPKAPVPGTTTDVSSPAFVAGQSVGRKFVGGVTNEIASGLASMIVSMTTTLDKAAAAVATPSNLNVSIAVNVTPQLTMLSTLDPVSHTSFLNLGDQIAGVIGLGMWRSMPAVTTSLIGTLTGAFVGTRSALGIDDSESALAAQRIGRPISAGIGAGVTAGLPLVRDALGELNTIILDAASAAFTSSQSIGVNIINGILAGMRASATQALGEGVGAGIVEGIQNNLGFQAPATQDKPALSAPPASVNGGGDSHIVFVVDGEVVGKVSAKKSARYVRAEASREYA